MRSWAVAGGVIANADRILMVHNHRRGGRTDWTGPLYTVWAEAVDMNWTLRVEVHLANSYLGELDIDDPDGIVREARWVQREAIDELLDGQQLWLREPLMGYLNGDLPETGEYRYRILGSSDSEFRVERI